jgi:hypothetical protein
VEAEVVEEEDEEKDAKEEEEEEKEAVRYAGRGSSGTVMAARSVSGIAAMVWLRGRDEGPPLRPPARHAQRRWGGEARRWMAIIADGGGYAAALALAFVSLVHVADRGAVSYRHTTTIDDQTSARVLSFFSLSPFQKGN